MVLVFRVSMKKPFCFDEEIRGVMGREMVDRLKINLVHIGYVYGPESMLCMCVVKWERR